jgi:hypothetical protein
MHHFCARTVLCVPLFPISTKPATTALFVNQPLLTTNTSFVSSALRALPASSSPRTPACAIGGELEKISPDEKIKATSLARLTTQISHTSSRVPNEKTNPLLRLLLHLARTTPPHSLTHRHVQICFVANSNMVGHEPLPPLRVEESACRSKKPLPPNTMAT